MDTKIENSISNSGNMKTEHVSDMEIIRIILFLLFIGIPIAALIWYGISLAFILGGL